MDFKLMGGAMWVSDKIGIRISDITVIAKQEVRNNGVDVWVRGFSTPFDCRFPSQEIRDVTFSQLLTAMQTYG